MGVIAGHARVEAAKRLEMNDVPYIILAGLTESQKRAYIIADNKLAMNSGWDEKLLAMEFSDLKEVGFNLDLLGFDASEIADITLGKEVNQPEYDESAASTVSMVTCPECGHSFPK
jgi:ParB-like chromosome segregation protein Spo0J